MADLPASLKSVEAVIRRFERAKAKKQPWVDLLSDAYDYAIPHKQFFRNESKGTNRSRHIFDSTAVVGVQTFASKLQGTLVPAWREWADLVPGPELPVDKTNEKAISEKLQEATEIFFSHLNHSNFDTQTGESFQDLAIGTGAILFDEASDMNTGSLFDFRAIPMTELVLEEGPKGDVETVWREFEVPARNIKSMYPKADISPSLQDKITNKPDSEICLIEGTVHVPDEKMYHTVVIDRTTKSRAALLFTEPCEVSPWIVFRWQTSPGETYGRGPVISMLSDIKTVNKIMEFKLRADALNVGAVYTTVTDGVLNPYSLQIQPNTIIPVMSNDNSNPSLRLLERPTGSLTTADISMEDLRNRIKEGLLQNMRKAEGPVKSATEIAIDNRELLERVSSSVGRLQTEFQAKVIKRGVYILSKNGKFPKIKIDGRAFTVRYASPLARAQDREEASAMVDYATTLLTFGPEQYAIGIDAEVFPTELAKKLNVPLKIVPDEARREEIKNRMADAAELQMQADQPQQVAANG